MKARCRRNKDKTWTVYADSIEGGSRTTTVSSLHDVELARAALAALPVSVADDRESWVRVGMAAKAIGEELEGDWHDFGSRSGKYRERDAAAVWRSFHGAGVGPGSLFALADQHAPGWREKVPSNSDTRRPIDDPLAELARRRGWTLDALRALGCRADRDCALFPMRDSDGRETGFKRRRGDNAKFPGGAKSLTNRGGKAGLFFPSPWPDSDDVLVADGEADTAAALSAGWQSVIGTAGSQPGRIGLTSLQRLCAGRRVILAPDPDEAGRKWLQAVGTALLNAGGDVAFIPAVSGDLDARLRGGEDLRDLVAHALPWAEIAAPETPDTKPQAAAAPSILDDNGKVNALLTARAIASQRPHLVTVSGDHWDYADGVFVEVAEDAVDAATIALAGLVARRSLCGDVRHLLRVETYRPPTFWDEATEGVVMVRNGALDVARRELRPHDPKYRARNPLPVVFDPAAQCKRFQRSLNEWLPDDPIARKTLIEWLGYCLVADVSQEKMLVLLGEGANGKGRYIRALEMLLGPRNVAGLPLGALRAERTFPTAALVGKLVNVCPESEAAGDLDEGWLKSLISGDTLEIERKGRDPFSFRNTARFIVQSNNPPHLSDKSEGIWRRLLPVRFTRTFRPEERDTTLDDQHAAELPGILNLALDGLHSLAARGRFEYSPAMQAEVDNYRRDCNPLAVWKDECLRPAEPDFAGTPARLRGDTAYQNYREWCRDNGHTAYSRNKWARELKRLGLEMTLLRSGTDVFRGFEGVEIANA